MKNIGNSFALQLYTFSDEGTAWYSTCYFSIISVCGINELKGERNVGTVLFDKSTLNNHCWTNEEFVLLSSRRMFQDLLPKVLML